MPGGGGIRGAKILPALWPKNQNVKQKQYSNTFSKDFLKILLWITFKCLYLWVFFLEGVSCLQASSDSWGIESGLPVFWDPAGERRLQVHCLGYRPSRNKTLLYSVWSLISALRWVWGPQSQICVVWPCFAESFHFRLRIKGFNKISHLFYTNK